MALTLKQDFTADTLANAAEVGPTLTFDRGSNATYFDSSGTLVFVPENKILQSQDLNTTWTQHAQITTVTTGVSDPLGGTNANGIVGDATSSSAKTISQVPATMVDGFDYIMSGYFKAGDRSWVAFSFNDGAWGGRYFDLSGDGAVGVSSELGIAPRVTQGIESVGNGWYRCWMVTTMTGTTSLRYQIQAADGDGDRVYAGDSSTVNLNFFGAQIERYWGGSTNPNTYVPTTTVALAQPRLAAHTYDTTTSSWINRGVLIEEARTNECIQSNDFNTTWTTASNATATYDQIGPDGVVNSAATLDISSSPSFSRFWQTLSGIVTASDTWCVSCFFKKTTAADTYPGISFVYSGGSGSGTNRYDAILNTDDGGITQRSVGGSAAASGTEDHGDWWRVWWSVTENGTGYTDILVEVHVAADNDELGSWPGNLSPTASEEPIVFGIQVEKGAFPTSYIPTTSASVTRERDDLNADDVSWLDTTLTDHGTFVGTGTIPYTVGDSIARILYQIDQGSESNRVVGWVSNDDGRANSNNSGGANGAVTQSNILSADTEFFLSIAYDNGDLSLSTDGTATSTDGTPLFPLSVAQTHLRIGSTYYATSIFNGYIKNIRYWDERKPNGFLENPPAMGRETFAHLKYNFGAKSLDAAVISGPTPVFSRGTAAMMFDSSGTLKFAPHNICLQSQTFENATWVESGVTAVDGTGDVTDPFGGSNATKITEAGTAFGLYQQAITVEPEQTYTWSFWHYKGTADTIRVRLYDETSAAFMSLNEEVSPTTAWTRYTATFTTNASQTALRVYVTRLGDNGTTYIYGAQLQKGSQALDYVVTTTAADYWARLGSHLNDGTSWKNRGYLAEEQRTNVIRQTHTLSANWSKDSITATENDQLAPDGTTTGALCVLDDSNGVLRYSRTGTANVDHVLSGFFRYVDSPWATITLWDNTFTDAFRAWFNIQTGVVGTSATTGAGGNAVYYDHGIEDVGGGWYRCWVSGYVDPSETALNAYFGVNDGDGLTTRTGGDQFHFWGGQWEQSARLPTSLIFTKGADVTRNKDDMTIANANLESFYYSDISDGTWIAKFTAPPVLSTTVGDDQVVIGGTVSQESFMYISKDNVTSTDGLAALDDVAGRFEYAGGSTSALTEHEAAVAWSESSDSGDLPTALDGVAGDAVEQGTNFDHDWAIDSADIGIGQTADGTTYLNGHVRQLRFYDYRIADLSNLPSFSGFAGSITLLGVG